MTDNIMEDIRGNTTDGDTRMASYSYVRRTVAKHGITVKKNYGQNFLIDKHVLDKILAAAELTDDTSVIEVGPGLGALTQKLCQSCHSVTAVEIDPALIPVLEEALPYPNFRLINADIMKTDIRGLAAGKSGVKLIANLPYYITTPIIMNTLEDNPGISDIIVMVQKEVGERMRAKPSTKAYGALSLAVAYYADCELVANVPNNCFWPRPDVDSCVIKLSALDKPRAETRDKDRLFRLIKAAFSMRRKTLYNCLRSSEGFSAIPPDAIAAAIKNAGFGESIRGEALNIFDFAVLADLL